jgi:hypothetical protein
MHEAFWDLRITGYEPEDQRDTTVPSTFLLPNVAITSLNSYPEDPLSSMKKNISRKSNNIYTTISTPLEARLLSMSQMLTSD